MSGDLTIYLIYRGRFSRSNVLRKSIWGACTISGFARITGMNDEAMNQGRCSMGVGRLCLQELVLFQYLVPIRFRLCVTPSTEPSATKVCHSTSQHQTPVLIFGKDLP